VLYLTTRPMVMYAGPDPLQRALRSQLRLMPSSAAASFSFNNFFMCVLSYTVMYTRISWCHIGDTRHARKKWPFWQKKMMQRDYFLPMPLFHAPPGIFHVRR
jgi:hypothetical protein